MKCEENYDIYEENLDIRAEEITKEKYKKILDNDRLSAITIKWAARRGQNFHYTIPFDILSIEKLHKIFTNFIPKLVIIAYYILVNSIFIQIFIKNFVQLYQFTNQKNFVIIIIESEREIRDKK